MSRNALLKERALPCCGALRDIPKTTAKTAKESHDQILYCRFLTNVNYWPCESPSKDVFILVKTLFLSHTRLFNMLHGLIDRRQFINNPRGGGGDTYRRLPYKIDRDFIENF